MHGDDDDPFDRSELEELLGKKALYPEAPATHRSLVKLVRKSASPGVTRADLEFEDELADGFQLDDPDDDDLEDDDDEL